MAARARTGKARAASPHPEQAAGSEKSLPIITPPAIPQPRPAAGARGGGRGAPPAWPGAAQPRRWHPPSCRRARGKRKSASLARAGEGRAGAGPRPREASLRRPEQGAGAESREIRRAAGAGVRGCSVCWRPGSLPRPSATRRKSRTLSRV